MISYSKSGEQSVFKAYGYSWFISQVYDKEYYYVKKNGLFGIVEHNNADKTMRECVPCVYPDYRDAYKKLCEDTDYLSRAKAFSDKIVGVLSQVVGKSK